MARFRREADVRRIALLVAPLELLSDTEHHGIEILVPGPALAVRGRGRVNGGTP